MHSVCDNWICNLKQKQTRPWYQNFTPTQVDMFNHNFHHRLQTRCVHLHITKDSTDEITSRRKWTILSQYLMIICQTSLLCQHFPLQDKSFLIASFLSSYFFHYDVIFSHPLIWSTPFFSIATCFKCVISIIFPQLLPKICSHHCTRITILNHGAITLCSKSQSSAPSFIQIIDLARQQWSSIFACPNFLGHQADRVRYIKPNVEIEH